jgi:hypothetical protein
MRNIQIKDSYNIWNTYLMRTLIDRQCYEQYGSYFADTKLS